MAVPHRGIQVERRIVEILLQFHLLGAFVNPVRGAAHGDRRNRGAWNIQASRKRERLSVDDTDFLFVPLRVGDDTGRSVRNASS
jgi:hypothetical protein